MSAPAASGLQKQVISLYKRCLRAALSKPPEVRESAVSFVRDEFRTGARDIKKSQFRTIEFMLRAGEKQLKSLSRPGTVGFSKVEFTPSSSTMTKKGS
jgi:succinate dehydrogenase assembly factor 1